MPGGRAALGVLPLISLTQLGADFRAIAEQTHGVVVLEVQVRNGQSLGSGFAVGDGTLVVTAHHVVDGARSIRVRLDDETVVAATEVLALDRDHDLALLKVDRALPPLKVSTGAPPGPGSAVLAVGNPQGLGLAFTDGIVSRVHQLRGIEVVQHSAPISPGNSGGPLLDTDGVVVGVNSFALATEHAQNVNFAISAAHVRALLADPAAHAIPKTALHSPPADIRHLASRSTWTAPEGQPKCVSAEEPGWPFPEAVRIHELATVVEDATGVCRHGQPDAAGPHLMFARYAVDPRDAGLTGILAELRAELDETGDPCVRAGRIPQGELRVSRNRDVLYVWLRAPETAGADLCAVAARIRDAAVPPKPAIAGTGSP